MVALNIIVDLEKQGFSKEEYSVTAYNDELAIGAMARGTVNGKPVVMIALKTDEGNGFVVAETTLALFLTAAEIFLAKYGDPRTQKGG